MVGARLVRLIENHSHELAAGLTEKLRESKRTVDFRKIPPEQLRRTTEEVYCQLGEWLLKKTESDIEGRFRALAARRATEGVALHQVVWALITSRDYLRKFLREEVFADSIIALYDELEMERLLNQFYDRAVYYTVLGYNDTKARESAGTDFTNLRRWFDPLSAR
jgi:hypothetical protein